VGSLFGLLAVIFFLVGHTQVKVLDHFPVHQVVFIRALGVLSFSLPYLYFRQISFFGKNKRDLFLRGLFGSIALFFYFSTLQVLPLSHAVLLQQLAPLFALLFSHVLLKESSNYLVYLLFAISFVGVYLVKDSSVGWSFYYYYGLVAAAFSALAYNFVRKLRKTDHPMVVLSYFQYCLIPVSLVGVIFFEHKSPAFSDVRPILLLAVFSFLAQLCLTLAYQKSLVAKASSFNFLAIPLSTAVGYFFFNEPVSYKQAFGMLLVFVCVLTNLYVINQSSFRWGSKA
jgi:drug/metabolite transporter (DMT)-like permease